MKVEGIVPAEFPIPCETNVVGRKYFKLRKYHYLVHIYPFWSDGELAWTAFRWTQGAWRKIGCFTRAQENSFPKTVAKIAHNFLEQCKKAS